MAARTSARITAPLALLAVLLALALVIHASGGSSSSTAPASSGASTSSHRSSKTRRPASPPRKTYVVRSGDSLSIIASRTGISTARLTALNPKLDPQSLQVGERIKLRP